MADVLIKEFVIETPNVFLGIIGFGATVPLPSIELTNISSSEEEIVATILRQVIAKLLDNIKMATAAIVHNFHIESRGNVEIVDRFTTQPKQVLIELSKRAQ